MAAFEVIALDTATPQLRAPGASDTYTFPRAATFSAAITYGGVTLANAVTGTGNLVLATNPEFTTPNLGTPAAATLTNATGLPLTTGVTGLLPVANGGTGTATPSLVAGTNITITGTWPNQTIDAAGGGGSMVYPSAGVAVSTGSAWSTSYTTSGSGTELALTAGPTFTGTTTLATVAPESNNASSVGYTGMPQNAQSAAYTLVAGDAGKTIVHPASDNNARTFTIPANASVAFPVGTTITFINMINTVTVAITSDTLYQAGDGSTGSRTLAAYGIATAVKVSSTTWIISGNGLS